MFLRKCEPSLPHRWMRVGLMVSVLVFSDRAVRVRTDDRGKKIYLCMKLLKTLTSIWRNSSLNPSIVLDREDHCFNQRFVQAEKKKRSPR